MFSASPDPRQPILGTELTGTIEHVGSDLTAWKVGDAVIAFPGGAMGCHAEYRVMAAGGPIAPKPSNLSFCLCFGGTTALHFLRKARPRAGEDLLVIGASGAVGSAMVQLATQMGARVTGVTSTRNLELVQSLGAEAVIDYTKADFATAGETFDIIADTVGASSFARCRPLLNEDGRYLAVAGGLIDMVPLRAGTKRSVAGPAAERPDDFRELLRLAAAGLLKPVVDKISRFSEMAECSCQGRHRPQEGQRRRVDEAMRALDTHPCGLACGLEAKSARISKISGLGAGEG